MNNKLLVMLGLLSLGIMTTKAQQEVQVDPLTGKAIIAIPIWKLNAGTISVPISLGYNGGGIKVAEGEGSGGMGWNLVAGGQISRVLHDLPDDYNVSNDARKGWLSTSNRSLVYNFNPLSDNGCNAWGGFAAISQAEDSEPDVFVFSAPGLSGKFVFDGSGTIRNMNYQDLKITYTGGPSGITSFAITTNVGVTYHFNTQEMTTRTAILPVGSNSTAHFQHEYSQYSSRVVYCSNWYLSSITGAYGETISFQYDMVPSLDNHVKTGFDLANNILVAAFTIREETQLHPVLSSIASTAYTAVITRNPYSELISQIQISCASNTHVFNLGYTAVSNSNELNPLSRSYLTSITEETGCNSFPAYQFDYYSPEQLPYSAKVPIDFFGYYNNIYNSIAGNLQIPPLYQNDGMADGERFRIYPKAGYTTVLASTSRAVNPATIYFGSLHHITYPTGGYAELLYEPNQVFDAATGTDVYGGGVRISTIRTSDGDADTSNDIIRNYEYKKADGTSAGHWLYNPVFAFGDGNGIFLSTENLAPDETILYERSSILYPGNGKTVYQYNVPGNYPQTSINDWTASKTRIVSNPSPSCPSPGTLAAGYYTYPCAPNTNYDFEQGLVSAIQHYDQSGNTVKEQNYSYQRLSPGIVTVKGMKWDLASVSNTHLYGLYSYMTNVGKTIQTETIVTHDPVIPGLTQTTSTNYVYNGHQLLSEQNMTNSDGKISKTQYRYANDFLTGSPSGNDALMMQQLCQLNMQASVVETVSLVNSSMTQAILNRYDNFGTSYVFLKEQRKCFGVSGFQNATINGSQQLQYDPNYYVTSIVEEYNSAGLPVTTVGNDRSIHSVLYGSDHVTVQATLENARRTEVVFSDFENGEPYQLSGGNDFTNVWSGKGALAMTGGVTFSKGGVVKATSINYRFRCRAKATTATDIALTINPGGKAVIYPAAQSGQWVFLESLVAMNGVSSPFTFQLTASGNVTIDDVVFYPENAIVQSATFDPFAGKTSVTDNRGFATFSEYDALGRLTYIRNSDKDLIQSHEYRYRQQPVPVPQSGFTCSNCTGNFFVGTSISLTAMTNCISPVSYVWTVNGASASSTSTLTYAFSASGKYDIGLTVSSAAYGSSTTLSHYDVLPLPLAVSATSDLGDLACGGNSVRTFSASATGCYDSPHLTCTWFFKPDSGNWTQVQATTSISALTIDILSRGVINTSASFKCVIASTCNDPNYGGPVSSESNVVTINRIPDPNGYPCAN